MHDRSESRRVLARFREAKRPPAGGMERAWDALVEGLEQQAAARTRRMWWSAAVLAAAVIAAVAIVGSRDRLDATPDPANSRWSAPHVDRQDPPQPWAEPIAPSTPARSDAIEPSSVEPIAAPVRRAPVRRAESPSPAPDDTLAREVAGLRRARAAIDAERWTDALAILAAQAREFPNGMLADERLALQISTLCAAGDVPGAKQTLQRWLAERPDSATARRIAAASCVRASSSDGSSTVATDEGSP